MCIYLYPCKTVYLCDTPGNLKHAILRMYPCRLYGMLVCLEPNQVPRYPVGIIRPTIKPNVGTRV